MKAQKKTIGILGGMGPDATVYIFNRIVKSTQAQKDQEHIKIVIHNNPEIPDRTDAILHGGQSPLIPLLEGAGNLERAGAHFYIIPCVTAHHFYNLHKDQFIRDVSIPLLHMSELTRDYILNHPAKLKRIGLIATSGTINTKLFQNLLEEAGLQVLVPDQEGQERFTEAVYGKKGVKAGYSKEPRKLLMNVVRQLRRQNAQAIIAGCTEIPLVLKQTDIPDAVYINPMQLLAEEAIRQAGYSVKS